MNNNITEYKNIEIFKIINAIAIERKIDIQKILQITRFALFEVFKEVYGNAKIDIEILKNTSEIKILECKIVVSDEDSLQKKYIFNDQNNNTEDKKEEEDIFDKYSKHYNNNNIHNSDDNLNLDDYIMRQIENIENNPKLHFSVIGLTKAREQYGDVKISDIIKIPIKDAWKNLENNTKLAKLFNKSFFRFMNEIIKEQEFIFFSKKDNQMISAFVKTLNRDGYILSHNNYEILLPSSSKKNNLDQSKLILKSETIPGEYFGIGEKIQVFIKLNKKIRTHPGFLAELLKQNIPEIRDGMILIKEIQRNPGIRSKVVVFSTNLGLDPVGACIGIKGVRIKSISKELRGEKIDIVNYSDNIFDLATNLLNPIKVLKIVETEIKNRAQKKLIITVDDKDLSLSIGKGGSNIKLISRILKMNIEIIGISTEESRRMKEYQEMIENFKLNLDTEEVIAQILIMNNYKSIYDISETNIENLAEIEYFDE